MGIELPTCLMHDVLTDYDMVVHLLTKIRHYFAGQHPDAGHPQKTNFYREKPMIHRLPLMLALALLPGMAVAATGNVSVFGQIQSSAGFNIVFDYSYDDSGFFADATRKNLLEAAAGVYEARITDSLGAITSNIDNEFDISLYDPRNPSNYLNLNYDDPTLNNVSLAANEFRIYVGGAALAGGTLGVGGAGSFAYATTVDENNNLDANGLAFYNSLSRGQAGYTPADDIPGNDTDFAPWGGSISFNSSFNEWYFDTNPGTTEAFAGRFDFYSVALHEIAHVLGIGIADSWFNQVNGATHTFTGAASGTVALENDDAHWKDDVTYSPIDGAGSFEAALDPSIPGGTRKQLTDLDWNGLRDVGWQVAVVPEPETWAMLLAGLGLVGMMARRRA